MAHWFLVKQSLVKMPVRQHMVTSSTGNNVKFRYVKTFCVWMYLRLTMILLNFLNKLAHSKVQFLQNWFQPHPKLMWRHQRPEKNAQHCSKQMYKLLMKVSHLPVFMNLLTARKKEKPETERESRPGSITRNPLSHDKQTVGCSRVCWRYIQDRGHST